MKNFIFGLVSGVLVGLIIQDKYSAKDKLLDHAKKGWNWAVNKAEDIKEDVKENIDELKEESNIK